MMRELIILVVVAMAIVSPVMAVSANFGVSGDGGDLSVSNRFSLTRDDYADSETSLGRNVVSSSLSSVGLASGSIGGPGKTFSASTSGGQLSSSMSASPGMTQGSAQISGSGIQAEIVTQDNYVYGEVDEGAKMSLKAQGTNDVLQASAAVDGMPVLDTVLSPVGDDAGVSSEGLFAAENSIGSYNIFAVSGSPSFISAKKHRAEMRLVGGSPNSYILNRYRFNTKDPKVKVSLTNNYYLTSIGLNAQEVKKAIERSGETWDAASRQNLFADYDMVTLNPYGRSGWIKDGTNTVSWTMFPRRYSGALAGVTTWYARPRVGGFYSVREFDISFNSRYPWTTTGQYGIDVQTVATHEFGHPLGLADLYNRRIYREDGQQIMNSYDDAQRTLGNGDIAGLKRLYG